MKKQNITILQKNTLTLVRILVLLLSVLYTTILVSQTATPTVLYASDFEHKKDSLLQEFGQNKTFIDKIELASLVALSHYPELKDTKIVFRRRKLSSTMAARPSFWSVFKRKKNRTYFIHLDDYEDVETPLDSADFNSQVGVIGHELAHIAYYEQKRGTHFIGLAFKYGNKKFKAQFERDTDTRTVEHGLGWQLYAFKNFVWNYPHSSEEYKHYKATYYLSPNDIKQLTIEYENQ